MFNSKNIPAKQVKSNAMLLINIGFFICALFLYMSVAWAGGPEQLNNSVKKTKTLQTRAANGLLGKPSFPAASHTEKLNLEENQNPVDKKVLNEPEVPSEEHLQITPETPKLGTVETYRPEESQNLTIETQSVNPLPEINPTPYDEENYVPYLVDENSPPNDQTIKLREADEDQTNLWDRVRNGFGMSSLSSKLVNIHEQNFSKNPQSLSEMIHQSNRYLYHIIEEVNKRGMPTEIALLPIIESAYNPNAGSRSNAAGLWQIIPSTGKVFGLKQNWWVDNRKNITDATDAALTYLERLKKQFGSWDLALAAYNAGQGTVGRAIKKNKSLGKPTNFSALNLPPETRNYIPKLQAIKNIILNPKKFGVDLQPIKDRPYFTKIEAPKQIDTALAAQLAEITDEEFDALNPGFNRPIIASSSEPHILLLPIEAAQKFQANLANYAKPLVSWQPYTIHPGENLSSVADMFEIKLKTLSEANQMPQSTKVKKPMTILVPNNTRVSAGSNTDRSSLNEENFDTRNNLIESDIDISQVQTSENIDLATLNALKNNHLALAKNQVTTATNKIKVKSMHYTVKNGDTLSEIAQKFNVSTTELMRLNRLKTKTVNVGQKLKINLRK